MMRVSGVDFANCTSAVGQVTPQNCIVNVGGRTFDVCGNNDTAICEVEPTIASGLHGCQVGAPPIISEIDPFCWVYNEQLEQFDAWGHGSQLGLL